MAAPGLYPPVGATAPPLSTQQLEFVGTAPSAPPLLGSGSGGGGGGGGSGAFDVAAPPPMPLGARGGAGGEVVGRVRSFLDGRGLGWLVPAQQDEWAQLSSDTGDERSLIEELEINPADIARKLSFVVFPFQLNRDVLRDNPDFWGPLLVVCTYALLIVWGQFGVMSWLLTLWVIGSWLISLLAAILGGQVGFSQTLGVIGYSVLPLLLAALLLLVPAVHSAGPLRFFIKITATGWAAFSASTLLVIGDAAPRRWLLVYPIFLLYTFFVLLQP